MARAAREISQSGLYHIVFRGVNKQHIFEEEADYEKLIEIISKLKREMTFEIYAYCLMSNHVHILLKEKETGEISLIMKRLLTKYARWYNMTKKERPHCHTKIAHLLHQKRDICWKYTRHFIIQKPHLLKMKEKAVMLWL